MTARKQETQPASSAGFTLIELLVVMIIVGVLAAVAIPVFLSQRAKAHDSATQADVSSLGKEVATYFVGGTGPLVLDYSTPGTVALTDGSTFVTTARLTIGSRPPGTGASANLSDPMAWCVSLTDPDGSARDFRYSSRDGLARGICT